MKITWLHSDGKQSHFTDVEVPISADGPQLRSALIKGDGASFSEAHAAPAQEFHNAPRRQFVVVLSGGMEVEIGDGAKRRFGPGELFLADDLTGQGHITRSFGPEPRCIMLVPIGPELDPSGWKQV
jgi:hypothetical protein